MNPYYYDGRCAYCGKDETVCAKDCVYDRDWETDQEYLALKSK